MQRGQKQPLLACTRNSSLSVCASLFAFAACYVLQQDAFDWVGDLQVSFAARVNNQLTDSTASFTSNCKPGQLMAINSKIMIFFSS